MKLFKFKRIMCKFFAFLILIQLNFVCSAHVDLLISPEDVLKVCENSSKNLALQQGKLGLEVYCPTDKQQILSDAETLCKRVPEFLEKAKGVDLSAFDDFCKNYLIGSNKKIKTVDLNEFQKYVESPDFVLLYRGVSFHNSEALRTGSIVENFRGNVKGAFSGLDNGSTSGNGMYFTTEYKHAKMWGDKEKGDVVVGVVDKKKLKCIDGSYVGILFSLVIRMLYDKGDEDFKEYVKTIGDIPEGREYKMNSSAFKSYAEIVKGITGFDYFSDENKKLDLDKRYEEFEKAEKSMNKKHAENFLKIGKEVYKNLYGTDKVAEMLPDNLQSPEFKEESDKKLEQDSEIGDLNNFYKLNRSSSYLMDRVYALSRNHTMLAKLLGYDAVCEAPPQESRGSFNPTGSVFDAVSGDAEDGNNVDENLLFAQKMVDTSSKSPKSSDYYDFVGDEVVLFNFDNLVVCSDKFEPKKD